MRKYIAALLGICLLLWSAASFAAPGAAKPTALSSVALVVKIQGRVQVKGPGAAKPRNLDLAEEVYEKQTITVSRDKGAQVVLAWHKGGLRYQLNAGSAATILKDGIKPVSGPAPARLASGTHKTIYRASDLRPPGDGIGGMTIRGFSKIRVDGPLGATTEDRPAFKWVCVPAASSARVMLYRIDRQTAQRASVFSREIKESTTSYALNFPRNQPELKPGELYMWVVEAVGDSPGDSNPNRTEALFWVVKPEIMKYLSTLRAAAEADPPDMAARVIYVRALWDAGFFDQAANAAVAFSKAQPDDPSLRDLAERLKDRVGELKNGGGDPMSWPTRPDF